MTSDEPTITKKLVNDVANCVDENLRGLVTAYPGLRLHPQHRVITLDEDDFKVAILSGGGSGHEPFAAGFVGNGSLTGAVCGGVFSSPPTSNILYAITHLHKQHTGGVLVIIANYTGDRLNFGKAIEKAKMAGLKVESIIFGEDMASSNNKTGGRGMCGLVFLYKMCGAMVNEGKGLDSISKMAIKISSHMATLGVCLRACSLPGQSPLFKIADDELDLGVGVHGEAGIEKRKLTSARDTVQLVLEKITDHLRLKARDRVVVMVNNLGGTSLLEMNILCMNIKEYLESRKIQLERIYSGHIMTSLEMYGFQICVLHLDSKYGDDWLRFLDSKTDAAGWPGGELSSSCISDNIKDDADLSSIYAVKKQKSGLTISSEHQTVFRSILEEAAKIIIENEQLLNRLDSGCGDGDCGSTLKKFGEAILNYVNSTSLESPSTVLWDISEIAEGDMGGTSGGIYGLGLTAAAKSLANEKVINISSWIRALENSLQAISIYGGAQIGDRTLLDALYPGLKALKLGISNGDVKALFMKSIAEAEEGARMTASITAKAGRASYVSNEHIKEEDAGARAAALWLRTVLLNAIHKLYT